MRIWQERLLHSPSDLVGFLGCAHSTALNLQKLLRPDSLPDKAEDEVFAKLIQTAGDEHEKAHRIKLEAEGGFVEITREAGLEMQVQETMQAMQQGARVIYQAAFLQQPWHGFADFLIRVEKPSTLGSWSYEPVDTKLALSTKSSHVVQLGMYAELLGQVQGTQPEHIHVALGDQAQDSLRLVEFSHAVRVGRERYESFIEDSARDSRPEPCAACNLCGWRKHCADVWEKEDALGRVVGLSRSQAGKLREAGIATATALAHSPADQKVKRLAPSTFKKLQAQARLQVEHGAANPPVVETLPSELGRGFYLLPEPDPADLFFDLEGDPLEVGGFDYLWGLHYRDGGMPHFRHAWANNPEEERKAFEDMLDWMAEHLERHPNAHVYHYAPYEKTALRRLSTQHASREELLDCLLRERRFVDLYTVVRQAIRTSAPNLSLKTVEKCFASARSEDVGNAADSVVAYHHYKETTNAEHKRTIQQSIVAYNKVDCENTEGVRNWLLGLRPKNMPFRAVGPAAKEDVEKSEARIKRGCPSSLMAG